MATAMATTAAMGGPREPRMAEEALLDVYDLQWKAIDIKLDQLRNECERMILEYEVELKQQMYLRECEELLRTQATQHEATRRELDGKQQVVRDAQKNAERQRVRTELKEQESERVAKELKEQEKKRAKEAEAEEKKRVKEQEALEKKRAKEQEAQEKKRAKELEAEEKKRAKELEAEEKKRVQSENRKEIAKAKETAKAKPTPVVPEPAAPSTPERKKPVPTIVQPTTEEPDDLLQMLSHDAEYESEDFGDLPSMTSLILPTSPAVWSPEKPMQSKLNRLAFRPLKTKKGVQDAAKRRKPSPKPLLQTAQPESEPRPSESESSPQPLVTPQKRALKRRKIMSPGPGTSLFATKAPIASAVLNKKESDKASSAAVDPPTGAVDDASAPNMPLDTSITVRRKKGTKKVTDDSASELEGDGEKKKKKKTAKKSQKLTAAEDEAPELGGFDIKTPKVTKKKKAVAKNTEIDDLEDPQPDFEVNSSEHNESDGNGDVEPAAGKKRRREATGADAVTPKKKSKTKNRFANDELNIMKSPVPLGFRSSRPPLLADPSGDKAGKKRLASDRDGGDDDEPKYGAPAQSIPASTTPGTPTDGLAAAAADYANRWLNSGLVTRAKKNAVKTVQKTTTGGAKAASAFGGGGGSFFDAFVNTAAPRLKGNTSKK
ncbi:hypothetical protein Poli38472_000927 [Pythium oligandrum]|uniref:Uncharacterized protein n=1 Tax=Pythium oligandrum TaxID=41045 RepID=A0A8K1FET0_PYTOL|nr:hypothetical protein Poli38472_000927 [Pythium oligandrum]|eukprot:TMW60885.1 hypothetical protein Poli38472_000927 [Pythium oligandrum]